MTKKSFNRGSSFSICSEICYGERSRTKEDVEDRWMRRLLLRPICHIYHISLSYKNFSGKYAVHFFIGIGTAIG